MSVKFILDEVEKLKGKSRKQDEHKEKYMSKKALHLKMNLTIGNLLGVLK